MKWDLWKLKDKAKGVFLGQNTENLQMNIKGKMYIRKISLNIGNPRTFTNLILPVLLQGKRKLYNVDKSTELFGFQ